MAGHERTAGGWALAAAAVALALTASYLTLVPTSTWNAGALFGAIGFADLIAAAIGHTTTRIVLLSAATAASVAMGILTASVGVVLLASAACAFMALRSVTSAALVGRTTLPMGIGAVVGLVALAAVWVAPRILVQ